MINAKKMIEPSLKAGSGTKVVENCDIQLSQAVINDGEPANLRCGTPNAQIVPTVLLKSKNTIKIATFNVRTGRENWRLQELIHHMEEQGICIVAIQEHRRVHEEVIKYERLDNHLIITSSAWRNSAQAAVGGVGFILNATAEKSLCEVVTLKSYHESQLFCESCFYYSLNLLPNKLQGQ